jgi:hypothetical protein
MLEVTSVRWRDCAHQPLRRASRCPWRHQRSRPAPEVPHERPRRRPPPAPIPLRRSRPPSELVPRGPERRQHGLSAIVEHRNPRDLHLSRPDADRLGEQLAPAPAPLDRLRARSRRRRPLPLAPARQPAVLGVERADCVEGLFAGGGAHAVVMMPNWRGRGPTAASWASATRPVLTDATSCSVSRRHGFQNEMLSTG